MRDAIVTLIEETTESLVHRLNGRQSADHVKRNHGGDEEEEHPHDKFLAALSFGAQERFMFAMAHLAWQGAAFGPAGGVGAVQIFLG